MSFVGANQKINSTSSVGGDVTANLQAIGNLGAQARSGGGGGSGPNLFMQERLKQADFGRALELEDVKHNNAKEMALIAEQSRARSDKSAQEAITEQERIANRNKLMADRAQGRRDGLLQELERLESEKKSLRETVTNENAAQVAEEIAKLNQEISNKTASITKANIEIETVRTGATNTFNSAVGGVRDGLNDHATKRERLEAGHVAGAESFVSGLTTLVGDIASGTADLNIAGESGPEVDTEGYGAAGSIGRGLVGFFNSIFQDSDLSAYRQEVAAGETNPRSTEYGTLGREGAELNILELVENDEAFRQSALVRLTSDALAQSSILPDYEEMTGPQKGVYKSFILGTEYIDVMENVQGKDGQTYQRPKMDRNGNPVRRAATIEDLSKQFEVDTVGLGYVLDQVVLSSRKKSVALREAIDEAGGRNDFETLGQQGALAMMELLSTSGLDRRGQELFEGQTSVDFKGIADSLSGDEITQSGFDQVLNVIKNNPEISDADIMEMLERVELEHQVFNQQNELVDATDVGTAGFDMQDLEALMDTFDDLDIRRVASEGEATDLEAFGESERSRIGSEAARRKADRLAAIDDPASAINMEIDQRTLDFERAGTPSTLDQAEVEQSLRERNDLSGMTDAQIEALVRAERAKANSSGGRP